MSNKSCCEKNRDDIETWDKKNKETAKKEQFYELERNVFYLSKTVF